MERMDSRESVFAEIEVGPVAEVIAPTRQHGAVPGDVIGILS